MSNPIGTLERAAGALRPPSEGDGRLESCGRGREDTMNSSRDALIIGGGIAGPVTAMALQRAGIKATVYEAYPTDAGAAGAFLTIAVNGLDALRTLDLHRQVMAAGFPTATIELFSGTGKRLGQVPIGGTLSDGTMTHTIKRADLYRILCE